MTVQQCSVKAQVRGRKRVVVHQTDKNGTSNINPHDSYITNEKSRDQRLSEGVSDLRITGKGCEGAGSSQQLGLGKPLRTEGMVSQTHKVGQEIKSTSTTPSSLAWHKLKI